MRLRWALLVSLGVHGALGWLLWGRPVPMPKAVPEVPSELVEVSLADEAGTGLPASSSSSPGVSPTAPARAPARTTGPGAATGGRTASLATAAAEGEGKLAEPPSPSGSAVGEGDRLATFRPSHPDLLRPGRLGAAAEPPRDLLASPLAKRETGPRELPRVLRGSGGVTARVGEDGSIHFGGPKDVALDSPGLAGVGSGAGVGLTGHFDVTDQIMKLAGQDPYASAKRELADATREARLCMAKRYQGERQREELRGLAGRIRRLALRPDLSAASRRALVFDIWDECLEEAESGPNYGAMARATILAVVREVFPAGTDRAYPPAELLALNQRRTSRGRFSPYDPAPAMAAGAARVPPPDAGSPACPMP